LEWNNITAGQKRAANNLNKDNEAAIISVSYSIYTQHYISLRLSPREIIEWQESGLIAARKLNNRYAECRNLRTLGSAYHSLSDYRRAIEYHEQALQISREIGDKAGEGSSLGNLGNAYHSIGEREKACAFWKEGVVILEAIELPNADIFRRHLTKFCKYGKKRWLFWRQ